MRYNRITCRFGRIAWTHCYTIFSHANDDGTLRSFPVTAKRLLHFPATLLYCTFSPFNANLGNMYSKNILIHIYINRHVFTHPLWWWGMVTQQNGKTVKYFFTLLIQCLRHLLLNKSFFCIKKEQAFFFVFCKFWMQFKKSWLYTLCSIPFWWKYSAVRGKDLDHLSYIGIIGRAGHHGWLARKRVHSK